MTQEPRFVAPPSRQDPVLLVGNVLMLDRDPPTWVVELIEQLDADTGWHQGAGIPLLQAVLSGEPLATGLAGDEVLRHIQQERLLLQHGGPVVF